jgi:SecD/SecF fusion protein
MEKQKRWQFYLILAVILLTLFNILPTIFYYSNPLKSPIDAKRAENVAGEAITRVNELEGDAIEWLYAFGRLLRVQPQSIQIKKDNPGLIEVTFSNNKEAEIFKHFLPKAGMLIPFAPAQLELYPDLPLDNPHLVLVSRQVDVHVDPSQLKQYFQFTPKQDDNGQIAPLYREVVYDRAIQLALGFGGPSKAAQQLALIAENSADPHYDDLVMSVAKDILEVDHSLGRTNPIAKRYFSSFSQIDSKDADSLVQKFLARIETLKLSLDSQKETLNQELKKAKENGELVDQDKEMALAQLESQRQVLEKVTPVIQKNLAVFNSGKKPLNEERLRMALDESAKKMDPKSKVQVIDLEGTNPYIQALVIDWSNDKITTQFYSDLNPLRAPEDKSEASAFQKDKLNQFIFNTIARASQFADEKLTSDGENFSLKLNTLTNTSSLLVFDLSTLASKRVQQLQEQLDKEWLPSHADLTRDSYPILSYEQFKKLPVEEQRLGLVIYAPGTSKEMPPSGFKPGSIYVIARGLDAVFEKYREVPETMEVQTLSKELTLLSKILQQYGFIGYSGASFGIDPAFRKDYIFELNDYYSSLLKATREDFTVKGSKRLAVLDFTDVEQRLLARNKIDDRIQEDLLKWKEEYNTAQVSIDATSKYLVPPPTKNPYWENFKLSFFKYFRGDDRKILKWGLDLSGGKTVRIGLRDHNHKPVTNPDDLKQAVNELYTRINNMGVSERTIRVEGNNIILDFPGSQGLSAADLIQASAMYFHIVNEKFSSRDSPLSKATSQFLQDVWNEAIVTNRKDIESINKIAWQHLGGDSVEQGSLRPISSYARELYDNGLRLAHPDQPRSHSFNDTLSSIAMLRGDEFTEWDGQTNPLMVIFHHYALEGSNLTNVHVGYDPTQGNILSFNVKRSYDGSQGGSPRDDFFTWTSQFAQDKITGTPKEMFTKGNGWRMAVILNNQVVNAPALRAALRDGGTISGHFSQREINRLAADLKAGSLSFTPQILSEENVSPELGKEERIQGIMAASIALFLVVAAMVAYYRFAGLVASCAVLLNILIMWGVLQNLGAALTLPGIAGIVLTIGMAVDANVLVFERVREEFKISGRIASAIQAGYRKAFSAIIDSNITTIIAALILIQFDSGPIKGFAVTLIIGILSSMFTALFMTRYFFAGWVQNPKHKTLTMSQFIGNTNFNFLAHAKKVIIASLVLMILGGFAFFAERKTLFGMDFTGGYSLNVELVENPNVSSYRKAAYDSFLSRGATANDVQIKELSKPNNLRIQLSTGMEEKGHPFYQMPEALKDSTVAYEYEKNPRISWVVKTLEDAGLQIVPSQLNQLDNQWTVVSGQLSDTMRNNALIALTLALISILIYITFRFEFKYAVASVIGLVHDVVITIGLLAMFHAFGFPVQIDLQVIGAIMTIIGYSLNDTIIVFDRIREDLHVMRKMSFREIINHSLNVTLGRTLMTSGTTLLVLVALVLLGGQSIFAFSLIMTIGVLVGTVSSLFIASPVLLYFHQREELQDHKGLRDLRD